MVNIFTYLYTYCFKMYHEKLKYNYVITSDNLPNRKYLKV